MASRRLQRSSCWQLQWPAGTAVAVVARAMELMSNHIASSKTKCGLSKCEQLARLSLKLTMLAAVSYNAVFSLVVKVIGQDEVVKDTDYVLEEYDEKQQGATAAAEAAPAGKQNGKREQRSACWRMSWTGDTSEHLIDLFRCFIVDHISRGKKTRGFKSCTRLPSKALELETHKTVSYNAVASALNLALQDDERLRHCWWELDASSTAGSAASSAAASSAAGEAALTAPKQPPRGKGQDASLMAGSVATAAFLAEEKADVSAPKRTRRGNRSKVSWTAGSAGSSAAAEEAGSSASKRHRKSRGPVVSSMAGPAASLASLASAAEEAAPTLRKRPGKAKGEEAMRPIRSAGTGRAVRACVRSLEHNGYRVWKKAVSHAEVTALVAKIKERVSTVLSMYGHSCSDDCSELLKHTALWSKSPAGWADLGEKPFGSMDKRGWIKTVGSGRIFDGTFLSEPALQAVQEHAKPLVAAAMHVSVEDLELVPERCAVKPEGSPALPAHYDGDHAADFQAILVGETSCF